MSRFYVFDVLYFANYFIFQARSQSSMKISKIPTISSVEKKQRNNIFL